MSGPTSLDLSQIRTDELSSAATFRALIGADLVASDITSGTITAGTGDIDFDSLGGGPANIEDVAGGVRVDDGLGGLGTLQADEFNSNLTGIYNTGKWLTGSDNYGDFWISPSNAAFWFRPPAAGAASASIDFAGRVNVVLGFGVGSADQAGTVVRYFRNGNKASIRANEGVELVSLDGTTLGTLQAAEVTNPSAALTLGDSSYGVAVQGTCTLDEYTVATLPTAATNAGAEVQVTDSNAAASGNFGATVAGGGSNRVNVRSDGTNWVIV